MINLTSKEREALLILFKDYSAFYNANSISKILKISHVGAQKLLKRLFESNIVIKRTIGKSIIYKINFDDTYTIQLLIFLLADEANNFKRWKEEFKELFVGNRIVALFGSAVKDYSSARDIDVLIVMDNKNIKEVNSIIEKKGHILPKKIHVIKLTCKDLLENVKNKNEAIINIIKNAVVLCGQNKYVEVLKNVASF
ncbi:nucleotidyltransferase domain-containing protein [Candidatus Woesearchaeota archaeon]|nr:nucleotidyltransferase domain-containing protein [Candidatus Woesearchaeota archaeon]